MSDPTQPTKTILTLILAASAVPTPPGVSAADIKAMVMDSIAQATSHGYSVAAVELNPSQESIPDSMARLRTKLQSQYWDGILIGFAVRGNKELTPLFEAAVNVAREVAPGTRMLFGNSPVDLMTVLDRNFGATDGV